MYTPLPPKNSDEAPVCPHKATSLENFSVVALSRSVLGPYFTHGQTMLGVHPLIFYFFQRLSTSNPFLISHPGRPFLWPQCFRD
jgi:hypothetical protein